MDAGLPQAIVVGRTLSAYTLSGVHNNELAITYTVYNEQTDDVTGVLLTSTLAAGVTLNTASQLPNRAGQELAWSLGTIPGFSRTFVTISVTLGVGLSSPPQLDLGAHVYATLNAGIETDFAPAATLRTDVVSPDLLTSTPDANTNDPFVQEQAAKLDYNPQAIFAFLNNDVGYESYVGSLRGARGTLWSASANSLDETSLGVALFRASGIPARYAHGTLSDPLSQQLTLSMFPATFQTTGYLPAGTTVSDPAHDPKLLAEARDHYWLQVDVGSGFVNADTSGLLGGGLGMAFTAVTDTFTEVADNLRHKVRVTVDAEIYSTASAAFSGAGGLGTNTVLDRMFNAVDLVGRPITVGQFVSQSSLGAAFFSETINTFTPYLVMSDDAFPNLSTDDLTTGITYQEVLTNYPLASQILTGLFANISLLVPGSVPDTSRHTLFDVIGPAARLGTTAHSIVVDPAGNASISSFNATTFYISAASQDRSVVVPLLSALTNTQAEFEAIVNDPGTGNPISPEISRLLGEFIRGRTRLVGNEVLTQSEILTAEMAALTEVKAYFDRPRVTATSIRFANDASDGSVHFETKIDLMQDSPRVIPYVGQAKDIVLTFGLTRGFLEDGVESRLVGGDITGTSPVSAGQVFAKAQEQQIPLVLLSGANGVSQVSTFHLDPDSTALISSSLLAGKLVLVPSGPVTVQGRFFTGWFEFDPQTGYTIGVLPDGSHGAIAAWIGINEATKAEKIAFGAALGSLEAVISVLFLQTSQGVLRSVGVSEADIRLRLQVAKYAQLGIIAFIAEVVKNVDPETVSFVGPFLVAASGQTIVAAKAVGIDPPVPTFLLNDLIPLPYRTNLAANTVGFDDSILAGAVSGTASVSHLSLTGPIVATWKSQGTSGFLASTLNSSMASVFDAQGNAIGSGQFELTVNEPLALAISGNASFAVTGAGRLSFYDSSASTLGVGVEWDLYQGSMTGDLAIALTSDQLTLNGVALPAGSYKIVTGSATLSGHGQSLSPTFADSANITVSGGTVVLGGGTGAILVGGTDFPLSNGVTLAGYSGTVAITADSISADAAVLLGTTTHLLRIQSPPTITADQNTPATFALAVETNLAGNYRLTAEAPAGWIVTISNNGQVTAIPAPGTPPGDWVIRLVARSVDNPALVASAKVTISVTATQPGLALAVNSDPIFTVPFSGAQLPTAFQATLHNLGPAADSYTVSFANLPSGFLLLSSETSVTIPAGQTGILGLYLQPNAGTTLPAPGTVLSFDVIATSTTDAAITQTVTITFIMPEVHAVAIASTPLALNTTPGIPITATLTLTAAGNVAETVMLVATTTPGLSATGLPAMIVLVPGQTVSLVYTITPDAATPLNSTLGLTLATNLGPIASDDADQKLFVPVHVVVPGADSLADASAAANQLGDLDLGNRLSDLSIALTSLVQDPTSTIFKSQALAGLESIESLLRVDPSLVTFANPLAAAASSLANAQNAAEVKAAVLDLGNVLDRFAETVSALRAHGVEVSLIPNLLVAQPGVPQQFSILLHNTGDQTTSYDLTLLGLPAGVTGIFSQNSITLAPGQYSSGLFATLTQTNSTELQVFEFRVVATASGFPAATKSATGTLQARSETVSVVSVEATPPFTDAGGMIAVSAHVLNAVNRQQSALASYVVHDASGAIVFTSTPVSFTLNLMTSLVTVDLGSFDSTGFANGEYAITVTIADAEGAPIAGAIKEGRVLIGSPVTGSITSGPDTLPPGTSTVTNTLTITNQSADLEPPSVVGLASVVGANDAIRNGDFVYVATRSGINVFNIAGANLANPQLVRVVGTGTDILKIRGNLLVAVRGGNDGPRVPNSTRLDTYSLADPANPQFLGTTGELPFSDAANVFVTETHAFIVHINLHGFFGFTIYDQTGSVIAVNITNPATPFFDGDAVSAAGTPAGRDGVNDGLLFNDFGTNTDGIGSVGLGVDQSGGKQNTWSIVQVSPTILYVTGSTSTGGETQVGSGVIHVIDISDPRNLFIIRDLLIPGTVHVVGIAVSGDKAVVTASQGGFEQNTNDSQLTGNAVLASLDISDPANPQIIRSQVLTESARHLGGIVALSDGLFAFTNLATATDPKLFVFNGADPSFVPVGLDVASYSLRFSGDGDLIFTADGSSLIIYQVHGLPTMQVTAQVQVPNNTCVSVVPGSFNIAPTSIIPGTDFDTLVWDISLSDAIPTQTFTWQSTVTNLQPGQSRALTLGSTINFQSQGTPGVITLAATNVVAKQVLSLNPATRTIRPGEETTYTLTIANPTTTDVTYDLAVQGISQAWLQLPSQVTVPAGGTVDVQVAIQSDPFAPNQDYDFTVTASVGPTQGSVAATLTLSGQPLLPVSQPQSQGVVVELLPQTATAGQGTSAVYRVRVTNTGSETKTYQLNVLELPTDVSAAFSQAQVTVPPGTDNFREVLVTLTTTVGTTAGTVSFKVTATAGTTSEAVGALDVVAQGVEVSLDRDTGMPGDSFVMTVMNSGSVRDTFDLAATGPAGFIATLASSSVTLDPGQSQMVTVTTASASFAVSGSMLLTVGATSRAASSVQAAASAQLMVPSTAGLTATFTPDTQTVQTPGTLTFVLQVNNTGNTEDAYTATIIGTEGGVAAQMIGLDGQPTLSIPIFRLPGLSSGAIVLQANLATIGQGQVTVEIKSLNDADRTVTAVATLNLGGTGQINGIVFLDFNADGVQQANEPGLGSRPLFIDANQNGVADPGEVQASPDGAGHFSFSNVTPGMVTLAQNSQPDHGVILIGPAQRQVTVTGGGVTGDANFGVVLISQVSPVEVRSNSASETGDAAGVFIRRLYRNVLGRDTDATGLEFWRSQLLVANSSQEARAAIVTGIWESKEHRDLQVDHFYATYFGRTADSVGRDFWSSQLQGGASEAEVVLRMVTSTEYSAKWSTPDSQAQHLYEDVLSREGTTAELAFTRADLLARGISVVARELINSEESYLRMVDGYYAALLHRAGEEGGRQHWLENLQGEGDNNLSPGEVAERFFYLPEYYGQEASAES